MSHPYLLAAAAIAVLFGIGLRCVLANYDREGRLFANYLIVAGIVFGVLAFNVSCASSTLGKSLNVGVAVSGAADIVTTRQAIARGGYEVNPLMQGGVWRQSLIKFVGVSGVIAGAQIVERKKPVLAHILRGLVIGMQGWAAIHNTKVMR